MRCRPSATLQPRPTYRASRCARRCRIWSRAACSCSGTAPAHSLRRASERVEQSLSRLTSFTEDMARRGMTVRSTWLDRGLYAPSPDEMMMLGLSSGELVARVGRLRIANDTPLAIERASLSASVLPDPEGDRLVALCRTARSRQSAGAGDAAHFGRQSRRQRCAPARGAGRARPACTSSAFPIWQRGKVIEFTRSIYRGDAYDFVAELRLGGAAAKQEPAIEHNTTTHMRREIDEIPEAAARLLDALGRRRSPTAGAALRETDPRFLVTVARGSSDHAALLPEICHRADRRHSGRLARAVARLDLWRQAEACRAPPASPSRSPARARHRRHGQGGKGRRRADDRHHQHRQFAAGAAPPTMPSTSWPGRNAASRRPSPSSIRPLPALPLMAHWTGDERLLAALAALARSISRKAIACDWMAARRRARRRRIRCSSSAAARRSPSPTRRR